MDKKLSTHLKGRKLAAAKTKAQSTQQQVAGSATPHIYTRDARRDLPHRVIAPCLLNTLQQRAATHHVGPLARVTRVPHQTAAHNRGAPL